MRSRTTESPDEPNAAVADNGSATCGELTIGSLAAPTRRGPFYALRYRNFRLFFVGQIVSVAGTWMQTVAQQWLIWSLTHQARWLGIISGASAIPYVLFSFSGGRVADRYSRRSILVWTQVAMMVLAFILWLLALNRWVMVQAWHVAVLSGLLGLANAYNMPAQQAFVTDIVDHREALGNAIALNSLRFNVARFVGPILAGWLLERRGPAECFFWNGLSFVAVIISLLMMRLPRVEVSHERLSMKEGFLFIGRHTSVLRTFMMVAAASLFAWPVSTLYPVFADRFHRGAGGFTALMAANGVGAALGGLAAAYFGARIPRRALIYGGAMVFGVSLLAFDAAPAFPLTLLSLFISGMAMIVFAISCNTKIQEDVSDELRGRVMAVYSLVFNGLLPVGGLAIGFMAQRLARGYRGSIVAVAIDGSLFLVFAAAIYIWSRLDRTPPLYR